MASTAITDDILGSFLNTRLQRKAKSVISTAVQFILTDALILLNVSNINEIKKFDDTISWELWAITGISIGYVLSIIIFLIVHAARLPKTQWVTDDVEEAFEKTNNVAMFDGLLELPYPAKFKGIGTWYLPYIFWGIFGLFLTAILILYILVADEVESSTVVAYAVAVLQVYQLTSDFSEYWVYTRNPVQLEESDIQVAVGAVDR